MGFATGFLDFARNDGNCSGARKLGRRWRRAWRSRPVRNMPIMTIALDRLAASFADRVFERGDTLLLRRRGTGHMEDFLLQDCAVKIVHTLAQGAWREGQSRANPISRKVVDIVEENPANPEVTQLLKRRGAFYVGKDPVGWRRLKRKRKNPGNPAGLILQLTQLAQM